MIPISLITLNPLKILLDFWWEPKETTVHVTRLKAGHQGCQMVGDRFSCRAIFYRSGIWSYEYVYTSTTYIYLYIYIYNMSTYNVPGIWMTIFLRFWSIYIYFCPTTYVNTQYFVATTRLAGLWAQNSGVRKTAFPVRSALIDWTCILTLLFSSFHHSISTTLEEDGRSVTPEGQAVKAGSHPTQPSPWGWVGDQVCPNIVDQNGHLSWGQWPSQPMDFGVDKPIWRK